MLCFWENGSRARRPTPAEVRNNLACSPSTLKIRRHLHGGESSGSNHAQGSLRDLNPSKIPTPWETPHWPLRKPSIPSLADSIACAAAHFGELWGARKRGGIRQAVGPGSLVGKDPPRGPTGQGSADAGGPVCGETPTAEFAIAP